MCTYTSGKHTKNDGKIHHFQWVNPLFLWPISTHRHRHGADLAAEARLLQRGPRRGVRLAAGEWEIPGPGTVGTVGGSPRLGAFRKTWAMGFSPSKIGDFHGIFTGF